MIIQTKYSFFKKDLFSQDLKEIFLSLFSRTKPFAKLPYQDDA
jgi:hypothetical protein